VNVAVVDVFGETGSHRFLPRVLTSSTLRGGIAGNDISNLVLFDSFALEFTEGSLVIFEKGKHFVVGVNKTITTGVNTRENRPPVSAFGSK